MESQFHLKAISCQFFDYAVLYLFSTNMTTNPLKLCGVYP